MKFGAIPVDQAAGAILAHSRRVAGRVLKKGRLLTDADLVLLSAAGVREVVAAKLEPSDVGEDAAATTVAKASQGSGLTMSAAYTGRCNLIADTAGVVFYDERRLVQLNGVDESITVAALSPHDLVRPGQLVATIKIIPFAAPGDAVERCAGLARRGGPLFQVKPVRARPVGLIQTQLDGTKVRVLDKATTVTADRLDALGCELSQELRCAHDEPALAAALTQLRAAGCEFILINGASAIVDRRDVVPAGLEAAGGEVVHFGMPVDPGNLLLLGQLDGFPVLGLPGCARSPKLNGFDWVLQRLLADQPVGPAEIMAMGAGGLLKEIPSRPLPRAEASRALAEPPQAPRVAAVILAAGQSRRMGATNKLLAEVDGKPMVRHAVEAALGSQAAPIIVVTGHEAKRVRPVVDAPGLIFAHNPDFADGLSTSVRVGLGAVPDDCDGAIIMLSDMPQVTADHLNRLIAAFNPTEGRAICVPSWRGKFGNPTLWARRFFDEMRALDGDTGAKHLIGAYSEVVAEVVMESDAVLADVDSPEALAALTDQAD